MAPRWVRTKEHSPGLFAPQHAGDDDWLLLSAGYVVGRVLAAAGHPEHGRFTWSLTGPHTPKAPVEIGGTVIGEEAAKSALLTSWRAWQEWAGMRDL